MATKKRGSKKNSLVANIIRRKRAGKSRSRKQSTVSKKSYRDMQAGWPGKSGSKKSAKKKNTTKRKTATKRKVARKKR